jgi:hypothetical protein
MNIQLLNITVDEIDENSEWDSPSGVATFQVNNKEVDIIIHPCGELDFEGPALSDEESDALLEAFNSSEEVNEAFPSSQYH